VNCSISVCKKHSDIKRIPKKDMATYKAKSGDSLCSIAYMHGLGNCIPLRNEPANAYILNRAVDPGVPLPGDDVTIPDPAPKGHLVPHEQPKAFVKRARLSTIRFVHGSQYKPYADDTTLKVLNISNYNTDRAGAPDGGTAFPGVDVRRFHPDAHRDIDAFKAEVQDLRGGAGPLQLDLEVLRPKYGAAGAVTGHESFPFAIRANRQLNPPASRQGLSRCYRTPYLRLVVDDIDKAAAPTQTLLVSDMHANGDSQVEILDQIVKASYTMNSCPSNPRCKCVVTAPIGTDRKRLKMAVHVLRKTAGGVPVVTTANAERRVRTWFRRVYAQAAIAPKLMQAVAEIDPPENLVSISNDSGLTAAGDGRFGFRINAPGKLSQVIGPITPNAGDTPLTTANALKALVQAPYTATVTENQARFVDDVGSKSADIVITEATKARVTIDQEVRTDSRQTLTVGRVNPLSLQAWDGDNFLVGSLEQRTVLKNYDTGHDRVDIFVVDRISSGDRGEAMMSGHRIDPNRSAIDPVKWSAFCSAITMDGTDNNPFSAPHEVGHVTGELVHAQGAPSQLMRSGTSAVNELAGSKRIRDGAVTYDSPADDFNLVERLRAEGAPLLEDW
jgi:hypothetical protein